MSMTDPLIGKKLGDYNIEGILGTGGMARVYRGYDDNLDRYAAIKVIEPQLIASTEEDEYRERFLKEARAIARLNHPNIVSVYQFNQIGSVYYIAMEYAEGDNLRDILKGYIRQGRIMPTEELLKVLSDIAGALDYAHQQNIIHRDIKPSNIIVTEKLGAVLTDFGLALNAMEGTIGNTFGSVHYIAPEQAISSAQSVPQSDQYSLAIVAYELLTGRVPFDDASAMSVALKHISDPPPPPTELNPNIPAEVEQVLMRGLDKEPTKRYPTAKEFVNSMELAFNMIDNVDIDAPETLTEAVGAPPETKALRPDDDSEPEISEAAPPSSLLSPPKAGNRTGLFAIVAIVLIAVIFGGYFMFNNIQQQNAAATSTAGAEAAFDNQTATQIEESTAVAGTSTSGAATRFADATANAIATQEAIDTATANANATSTEDAIQIANANATSTEDAIQTANANATSTEDAIQTANANATSTQNAQDTATANANSTQTAIVEAVTPTERSTSTQTPTSVPTNTPRPTLTPTPSFFITTEIAEEDMRQILLRYDGRSIIISNRDTVNRLDLGDLRFVLFEPNDDGDIRQTRVYLINGSNIEDRARNMIPERCLQILDSSAYSQLPPNNLLADNLCDARPFWVTNSRPFWLSDSPEAYFEVRLGPVDVIGRCEAQVPLTRSEQRCAIDINSFLP